MYRDDEESGGAGVVIKVPHPRCFASLQHDNVSIFSSLVVPPARGHGGLLRKWSFYHSGGSRNPVTAPSLDSESSSEWMRHEGLLWQR